MCASCSGGGGATLPTAAPPGPVTTPAATAPVTVPPRSLTVPGLLAGFPRREITLSGDPWLVAVADTPQARQQGLMNVIDLGSLDGMLFVFEAEREGGFWMKDTLLPLEIAFFRDDGSLVDVLAMEPCAADPCPVYTPSGAYRYAVEAVPGPLGALPPGATLEVEG